MARKLKKVENETQTLFGLEYGKKHRKTWKMRIAQCSTWNMAKNLKNTKNEKCTV
jgi:hypothetical protein